jgi:hypothetical protein
MSMNEEGKTGEGESKLGFSVATVEAVKDYEEKHGKPREGEPITLKVLELSVTVENPVRDYKVVVGSGG